MFKKDRLLNFSHLSNDFPASIVVWLVALPLCLGIAQGSGAEPFTGIGVRAPWLQRNSPFSQPITFA